MSMADPKRTLLGQPKDFENEFQNMKKGFEKLQAKNREIAAQYDSLVAYIDQQFKLLRDAIKSDFSDMFEKLNDEAKRLQNTNELQLMANKTLQTLNQLVTQVSRPAGKSHPLQAFSQDERV
jgi:septation ring formation regulator EzrA